MAALKKGSKAAKDFMAKIRAAKGKTKPKKVGATKILVKKKQTGGSNRKYDKEVQALPPGKRKTAKTHYANGKKITHSTIYTETRKNRSDKGKLLGIKNMGSVYENKSPSTTKMMVKISELAYIYAGNFGGNGLREYLKSNAGKWAEVETNFLFDDQYNLKDGYRVYDTMITNVKNDARIGNKQFEDSKDCAFLDWNGIKPYPRPINHEFALKVAKQHPLWKNEYLIGTYRLNIVNDHYCLQNGRQIIKFLFYNGDYYLTTGIGYRKRANLVGSYPISYPIPSDVKLKVYKILNSL